MMLATVTTAASSLPFFTGFFFYSTSILQLVNNEKVNALPEEIEYFCLVFSGIPQLSLH